MTVNIVREVKNILAVASVPTMRIQSLRMRLDIYEESILRTVYEGEGRPVAQDELSPFDLAAAFSGLDFGSGLLPHDTLWCKRTGRDFALGIYLPPARRTLRFSGEPPYTIPTPALIFSGEGKDYSVWALGKPGWPDARTRLFHAPFPNVYGLGKICAGSVKFPVCAPGTIHRAAELFFESEFNHDLVDGTSKKYPRSVVKLWAELAQRAILEPDWTEYPVDDMVEMGLTLGKLVKEDE
jgi:PRTRC genetic system protein B